MLLRPRKSIFKNFHKKRTIKTIKHRSITWDRTNSKLSYGQFGLKNNNAHVFIFNKHLFKIKLFLKKTVRRSNITNRYLWISVFPHLPVTKKVIGSRMGKGKGKPSNLAAKIPSNLVFIELRNVRLGRAKYFLRQVSYKLPGKYSFINKYTLYTTLVAYKNIKSRYDFFY